MSTEGGAKLAPSNIPWKASRALALFMTLGALACSFSRSGVSPIGPGADGAPADPDAGPDSDTIDSDTSDASDEPIPDDGPGDADASEAASLDDAPTDVDATDAALGLDASHDTSVAEAEADAAVASDASDAPAVDEPETTDASDGAAPCANFPKATAFTPAGGSTHCYWLHDNASNWLSAANTCTTEGGHLVTLTTDAETNFLIGWLPPIAAGDRIWIGGTDGRFSGDGPGSGPYVWITGEPFVYTNWLTSATVHEPDGLCDTCMGSPCYCEHRIAIVGDGSWTDAYEAVFYRFVCEADR